MKTIHDYIFPPSGGYIGPMLSVLPGRLGGLGLSFPCFTADVAFEASQGKSYEYLRTLSRFLPLPTTIEKCKTQRERTREFMDAYKEDTLKCFSPEQAQLFTDLSSDLGSRWLHTLPLEPRLTFSDGEFMACVTERLLAHPNKCRFCDSIHPYLGHHLHCSGSKKFVAVRHEIVKHSLARRLGDMGVDVVLEPPNKDGSRRADLLVTGNVTDGTLALDVTICAVSGVLFPSFGASTNKTKNAPDKHSTAIARARIHETLNRRFYKKLRENAGEDYGGKFVPWVCTTGGTLHKSTAKFMDELKKKFPNELNQAKYELSCSLAKSRARCYMQSFLAGSRNSTKLH